MSGYLDTLNALLPDGLRFEWVAAEPLPDDVVDQAVLVSGASRAYVVESLTAIMRASSEHRERVAAAHRLAWSGPDKLTRQILQAYRLSAAQTGSVPKSAFSSGYRRRQRARVKRRRR